MLADAHIHLFSRGYPPTRELPPLRRTTEIEAYEGLSRTHDIAAALVIGYEADGIDAGNNAYIRRLAAERPWLTTLAYVPATPAPTAIAFEALLDDGHAGITAYAPDAAAAAALAAWPADAWGTLARRRAIVSFNARPGATALLAPIVRGNPSCRFLFSHLGLPGKQATVPSHAAAAERIAALLSLADCSNAFVKISGLYAVSDPPIAHPHEAARPFIDLLLERFGATRCLWASDFSPALEFVSFEATTDIPWLQRLSASERAAVMGDNLLRMLGRETAT